MPIEVTMPKFGLTMHDGTIQRFFKQPGDRIRAGEPLFEVETEKVLYEVEAPATGTLATTLFAEGDVVECGRVLAVIAVDGDDPAAIATRYAANGARVEPAAPAPPASTSTLAASAARRAISPVARKLAIELGVSLDNLTGSGPGGRVTREDVERAAAASNTLAPSISATATAAQRAPTIIPMRDMRRTIAERMHQSLQNAAQLTITTEADVSIAVDARARFSREFDLTYTDMIIHAVARALVRHPRMNARLTGQGIELLPAINVGMAVALDDGLIVPVIAATDQKPLREIAALTASMAVKARAGKLKLEDVSGGTFTVTNLGAYGVDAFTPILNPGETGILGVGRIVEKPAIYRNEIAKRSMLTFSLTFDHRVIDGAPAAQFLQSVIELLNHGER